MDALLFAALVLTPLGPASDFLGETEARDRGDELHRTLESAPQEAALALEDIEGRIGRAVDNLTHQDQAGYKRWDLNSPWFTRGKDFRRGGLRQTGNQFSLAIDGDGFFQLFLPDGSIAYTRDGDFHSDSSGTIVSGRGYALEPEISVRPSGVNWEVSREGIVTEQLADGTLNQIATLQLATFINPGGLQILPESMFRETASSGTPLLGNPGLNGTGFVIQGYLEESNVRPREEEFALEELRRTRDSLLWALSRAGFSLSGAPRDESLPFRADTDLAPFPEAFGEERGGDEIVRSLERIRWKRNAAIHNLANIRMSGFKRLDPNSMRRDFRSGGLRRTNMPLQIAIEGKGFFQILTPDGSIAYSRDGDFEMDSNGALVTHEGFLLEPQITIPSIATRIDITEWGAVSETLSDGTQVEIGQILLANFSNPEGMSWIGLRGMGLFRETRSSGSPVSVAPGQNGTGILRHGFLESSNVSMREEEMAIETLRHQEESLERVRTADGAR